MKEQTKIFVIFYERTLRADKAKRIYGNSLTD